MKKFNDYLPLIFSFVSVMGVVVTCTMFIASMDKSNAVNSTLISSMQQQLDFFRESNNARFDKIEGKLDKLFEQHE